MINLFNKFIYGTVRVQANLSAFELSTQTLRDKYNMCVEVLDIDNDNQIQAWCNIINHSYTEFNFNLKSAKEFLNDKKYFINRITYLFTDSKGGGGSIVVQFQLHNIQQIII